MSARQGNYVQQRTETVSDTVRSTKVHVEAGCARTLLQPLSQNSFRSRWPRLTADRLAERLVLTVGRRRGPIVVPGGPNRGVWRQKHETPRPEVEALRSEIKCQI